MMIDGPDTLLSRDLTRQDLDNIVNGAAILGGGGGGALDEGTYYTQRALRSVHPPRLISISSLSTDALIAAPYLLGAVSIIPASDTYPAIHKAFECLMHHLNKPIAALLPVEMGASNVALTFYLSAVTGVPVLDADPTGRSVPECSHSTFAIHNVPVGIVCAATSRGEAMLFKGVESDQRAEQLLRAVSAVSGNDLSVIDHAMPLRDVSHALIRGTVSRAYEMGKTFQNALAQNGDPANDVAATHGGRVVFRGCVSNASVRDENSFTVGNFKLEGHGERFHGRVLEVVFKNENMYAKSDGKIYATIPEIISSFNEKDGSLVLSSDMEVGLNITVVVLPAPSPFLTEKGLAVFGPQYMGLTEPFKSCLC